VRRAWVPTVGTDDGLPAAARAQVHAAGDRLAARSPRLAQAYAANAAAAWHAFGEAGFVRWVGLGEELAASSREGAAAYFALPPAAFGPGGLETVVAWCALGREVAARSRRFAAAFFERSAPALAAVDAVPRLAAWVEAGLALHERGGWRGGFLAQAYFEDAPGALTVLGASDYGAWVEALLELSVVPEGRTALAALPFELAAWTVAERAEYLAATRAVAAVGARAALVFYRELPPAVGALAADERAALVHALATAGPDAATALAEVVPVAGALLLGVPAAERLAALARVQALAERYPEAALAALRVLPRLYEEAPPARVERWFLRGVVVADANVAAVRPYYALESRTSLRTLGAASTAALLEDGDGVWRKLVVMLSGAPVRLRAGDRFTLRPPRERDGEATLPERVDALATHEDNWRIYRFLAIHVAGRRAFGTYEVAADDAPVVEELFLLAEGVRVQHRLAEAYGGLAAEGAWVAERLLAGWRAGEEADGTLVLDALLALALAPGTPPPWLAPELVALVRRLLAPLASPGATARDSLRIARGLASVLEAATAGEATAAVGVEELTLELAGGAGMEAPGEPEDVVLGETGDVADDDFRIEVLPPEGDRPGGGRALSADELLRLLEAGAPIQQAVGQDAGEGIPITALAGKVPADVLDALRRLLDGADAVPAAARRGSGIDAGAFLYDEWDHVIDDYRSRWCRLREVGLANDAGEYFSQTLARYATLVPEVRRLLQRIPPEMYRPVRGLEDGEDFDLNAVTEARVELRARRTPSPKLYRARIREARDVATLFLLDMSASTDEPLSVVAGGRPGRRIIDAIKESLVVMSAALEELGDAYAIYGFSGQGRDNVEFYPVKGFAEGLSGTVKGRIGGIEPRRSTRMGTALRHAVRKLGGVAARSKHLILLSDGFPQDHDYGEDRRSHVYGIRDTAVALREADAAGITSFCITVDRAGHDYLREMCDVDRYLVIDDIAALPRELPRIYRRVVRA
jgi:hypothetical protein